MSAQIGDPPPFPDLPPGPETFVQALSTLREASHPIRRLALQGAIEVALGSGTLPLAQNHALRTVVDALKMPVGEWVKLMSDRIGIEPPEPWDPGLKAAWRGREGSGSGPAGSWDDAGSHSAPRTQLPEDRIERIKALALLGLDEEAEEGDIKRAFHRVSRVHHPDHYASLGAEAALEADRSFRRIKEAYEFLLKAGA
jgi:DnaJ like chaperone protein